jgi:hypothetical protein
MDEWHCSLRLNAAHGTQCWAGLGPTGQPSHLAKAAHDAKVWPRHSRACLVCGHRSWVQPAHTASLLALHQRWKLRANQGTSIYEPWAPHCCIQHMKKGPGGGVLTDEARGTPVIDGSDRDKWRPTWSKPIGLVLQLHKGEGNMRWWSRHLANDKS